MISLYVFLDVYPDGRVIVYEGAVNARARHYAKSIYNGVEDDQVPFDNIILAKSININSIFLLLILLVTTQNESSY